MMLINCPHCGERAQIEYSYVRSIDSIVALDMPPELAMTTLYTRANPKGESDELWRHTYGCRQFLMLRRHTLTHEIVSVMPYAEALT
jgi:sarcosine oxidase subunit delta